MAEGTEHEHGAEEEHEAELQSDAERPAEAESEAPAGETEPDAETTDSPPEREAPAPGHSSATEDTALFWLEDEEVPELDFGHAEDEQPLGTKRAARGADSRRADRSRRRGRRRRKEAEGSRRGSQRAGRSALAERRAQRRAAARKPVSTRRIWLRRVIAMLSVVLAGVFVWFVLALYQPFHGPGHGSIVVTIPSGASTSEVGSLLEHDGVINSGFFFKIRAELEGDRGKILAGRHKMQLDMSYAAALKVLTTPPPPVPTTNVTIVPGKSRKQVDQLLKKQGVAGSYLKATKHSKLLKPTKYGAPKNTPSLEGFLFPDTYQLRKPVKVSVLVDDQLKRFKQQFKKVNFKYAKSKNLTEYDVLNIASLIEGEAQKKGDLPLVASVIYNRLAANMDLGLDSTVEYATGNYGTLTASDLNSPSPYNTRNHAGLPPTPINSPGMDAIRAAAHPAQTNYLYFINKVCGGGKLLFTDSYTQFLTWSQDWNTAVANASKTGGSAEFCKKNKKKSKSSSG